MPSCGNSKFRLSNEHSEPDGCFSPFSDVNHWASRTFKTNQPSPAGARPEPESSSGASGTARVYGRFGAVPPPLLPLPVTCEESGTVLIADRRVTGFCYVVVVFCVAVLFLVV